MAEAMNTLKLAIIGGGPAGLMAAEVLSNAGMEVHLFDAMPSVGRKFLMAGKGGMNITHAEPTAAFRARYAEQQERIAPLLDAFGPEAIRDWMRGLGIESFVGSSGRVFPVGMKAAPLLRAWLHRLRVHGVRFHVRHCWQGWTHDAQGQTAEQTTLFFTTPQGESTFSAEIVLLALGGGSWPQLGSDGRWMPLLEQCGIPLAPLRPANCGFNIDWSEHFRSRFAGEPVKAITASLHDAAATFQQRRGECLITAHGIEGGLIYALSAALRERIAAAGSATLHLDLLPDRSPAQVLAELAHPRGARSLSSHLQSRLGLKGVKAGLLREIATADDLADPRRLTTLIKALPLRIDSPRPLEEAISSAGGIRFTALEESLMLRELPGIFCAGEMLDWEAPTGGYLLTACLASGYVAGKAAIAWLSRQDSTND